MASKSARTLSFLLTADLLRAREFTSEEIVHDESREGARDLQVWRWVAGLEVEVELIASLDQPVEQFVNPVFLLVGPLGHRIHQRPPLLAQPVGCFHPASAEWVSAKKSHEIFVVNVGIRFFIELAFPSVIRLELDVETIVISHPIL